MRYLLPLALLATAFGQEQGRSCEAVKAALEHPVDDYIAEINKEKSKRKTRNKNPLPTNICIFGWCRSTPTREPRPRAPETQPAPKTQPQEPGVSSSEQTQVTGVVPSEAGCPEFEHDPIEAAQNTDVGDFYFEKKNYRAALSRYQEALEQKPGDPAIHLRLGRAYEELEQREQAREHFQLAADAREGPWTAEAKAALERMR
jgi:tetratricopeptide (TPR) repeat protein